MTFSDALVVPIKDVHGSIKTLQVIDSKGGKYLLTNGEKAGNFLNFGDISTATEIIIAEGIATAGAIKQCINSTVVAAIDAGNLKAAAINIREVNPNAKIIMAADDDIKQGSSSNRGITDATAAAEAVNGYVAIPEMNGEKCDFWDVYNVLGHQAVGNALKHAKLKENLQSTLPTNETGFRVGTDTSTPKVTKKRSTSARERLARAKERTTSNWLIKKRIGKKEFGFVFGESGAGKSWHVLDLSVCLSSGIKFHGETVQKTNVYYVAGEGNFGIDDRLLGFYNHYEKDFEVDFDALQVTEWAAAFMDESSTQEICDDIQQFQDERGEVGLIVIDTLHRNLGNGNESSSQDMGHFISEMTKLSDKFNAAILVVHHCGLSDKERVRGSSSMYASSDFEYRVESKNGILTVSNTKIKTLEPQPPKHYQLKKVMLGVYDIEIDEETGEEISEERSSLILLPSDESGKGLKSEITPRNTEILTHIKTALEEHGIPPLKPIPEWLGTQPTTVLTLAVLRQFVYDAENVLDAQAKNSVQKAIKAALPNLSNAGYINYSGDYIWWIDQK